MMMMVMVMVMMIWGAGKKEEKGKKDDCLSMQILLFLPSNIVYFFIQKYNNFYTTSNLVSEIEISNPLCATWQRAWQNTIEHTKLLFLCLLAKLIAQFCWRDSTQKTLFLCSSFCNFPLFWFLIIFFLILFFLLILSHTLQLWVNQVKAPHSLQAHTLPHCQNFISLCTHPHFLFHRTAWSL